MTDESSPAWTRLQAHRESLAGERISDLFDRAPDRGTEMTVGGDWGGVEVRTKKNNRGPRQ
ncbi:hypothetical protein ACFXO7_23970, partial [Nocardia tengchongensis]|uniref:hypothetical protein n=1 Tax=Nocardia tengchongensis TaxID=2055889 RepID=UPI00369017B1